MFLDFHLIVSALAGDGSGTLVAAVAEAPVSRSFKFDRLDVQGLKDRLAADPAVELEELRNGHLHLRSNLPRDAAWAYRRPEVERHLGEQLFSTLFPDGSSACELLGKSCLRADSEGKDLRIKLELHPVLSNLPWETMSCPATGSWAYEINRVRISHLRYLGNLRESAPKPSRGQPLVLILLSDPGESQTPELTASFLSELEKVKEILRRHRARLDFELIQGPGTLRQLRDLVFHLQADRRPVLGLHYIGHGGVDQEGGFLLGEGETEGSSQRIHEAALRRALDGVTDLRWAIFNACSTAYEPLGSPLAGLATGVALLKNVPTVIAYQRSVATGDAELLAPELYKLILEQGLAIDEAVRTLQLRYENPGGLVVLAHAVEGRVPADLGLSNRVAEERHLPAEPAVQAERDPAEGELGAMVLVPAGPFRKGLSPEQIENLVHQFRDNGLPADLESARDVLRREKEETFDLPAFEIDRTPVTNGQFAAFVEATAYLTEAERARAPQTWRSNAAPDRYDHPVVLVSYYDAQQFCRWAGKRLPTADEWKKAYRGVEGNPYPWGERFDPNLCNTAEGEHGWQTTPVGRFEEGRSPYGCLDLLGNVEEWTATADGDGLQMVLGASWCMIGQIYGLPVLHRLASPQFYSNEHGFRCARDVAVNG